MSKLLTLAPGETSIARIVTIVRQFIQYVQGMRSPTASNITIYVDPVNGKDSNDGLSIASAFLTIQAAVNSVHNSIDLQGSQATVLLADGTYSGGAAISDKVVGQIGMTIKGAAGHAASVIINVPAGQIGFRANDYGEFALDNMTITGGAGSWGVSAQQFGILDVNGGVVFGAFGAGGRHIAVLQLGSVNLLGNYSITGGAAFHATIANEATISSNQITVPISSNLTFTSDFINISSNGTADMSGWAYSGAAGITGQKFNVDKAGVLLTGTDPNTVFPGNSNGTVTYPGVLDYQAIKQWVPVDQSGASLTITNNGANSNSYWNIGKFVIFTIDINYPATASGAQAKIGGLPFTVSATGTNSQSGIINFSNGATIATILQILNGDTAMNFLTAAFAVVTNTQIASSRIRGSGMYFTD